MTHKTALRQPQQESDHQEEQGRLTTGSTGHQARREPARPVAATVDGEENTRHCPECSGSVELTKTSRGEYDEWYCPDCGLVLTVDDIDHGPEWRDFGDEGSEPSRGTSNRDQLKHDYGLGSQLSHSSTASRQYQRMKRLHGQHLTSVDRSLCDAITEIRTVVSQLGYDRSLSVRATTIFRNAQDEGIFGPGSVREIFVGAAVLTACRELKLPVLPSQITDHLKIDRTDIDSDTDVCQQIQRRYMTICRGLGLKILPLPPVDFVPLLVDRLSDIRDEDLSGLSSPARAIVDVVSDQQWTVGKNPRSIAGGALYIAGQALCEKPPTQRAVAEAADLTSATIRDAKDNIRSESESVVESATSSPGMEKTPAVA